MGFFTGIQFNDNGNQIQNYQNVHENIEGHVSGNHVIISKEDVSWRRDAVSCFRLLQVNQLRSLDQSRLTRLIKFKLRCFLDSDRHASTNDIL